MIYDLILVTFYTQWYNLSYINNGEDKRNESTKSCILWLGLRLLKLILTLLYDYLLCVCLRDCWILIVAKVKNWWTPDVVVKIWWTLHVVVKIWWVSHFKLINKDVNSMDDGCFHIGGRGIRFAPLTPSIKQKPPLVNSYKKTTYWILIFKTSDGCKL